MGDATTWFVSGRSKTHKEGPVVVDSDRYFGVSLGPTPGRMSYIPDIRNFNVFLYFLSLVISLIRSNLLCLLLFYVSHQGAGRVVTVDP